ncbi:MAG: hypothetical protein ACK5KR_07720 [Breznakia sp.]
MENFKIGICDDKIIYIKQIKKIVHAFSEENAFPIEIIEYENGKQLIDDKA